MHPKLVEGLWTLESRASQDALTYGPPCLYPDSVIRKCYSTMNRMWCANGTVSHSKTRPPPQCNIDWRNFDVFKGEIGEKLDDLDSKWRSLPPSTNGARWRRVGRL